MTSTEKAKLIAEYADEMKAEQVETLDVRAKTSVADYFVVCGGTSDRHVSSIAEKIAENLRKLKIRPLREEGSRTGWVLQDYGDVVLHVMREEQRQFYDLEKLWTLMPTDPNLK